MYLMSNEIAVLEILVGLDKNDWKILESTNIKFYVHVFFSQLSDHICIVTLHSNFKFHHHFIKTTLRVGFELVAPAWESRAAAP